MGQKSGWNLPDGCFDSDIPGNRPEDIERNKWEDDNGEQAVKDFVEENIELFHKFIVESLLDNEGTYGPEIEAKLKKARDEAFKDSQRNILED